MGRYTLEERNGQYAEKQFQDVAKLNGYTVAIASVSSNIVDHIDMVLSGHGRKIAVDVKARKKKHRGGAYDDSVIWVEFHNVRGNQGWVYGMADKIAFERAEDFLFVDRENL